MAGRGGISIKGITSGRATIPQQNATNLRLYSQYKLYFVGLKMTKRGYKLWRVRKGEDLRGRSWGRDEYDPSALYEILKE